MLSTNTDNTQTASLCWNLAGLADELTNPGTEGLARIQQLVEDFAQAPDAARILAENPDVFRQVTLLRALAAQASDFYGGWLSIWSARTAGYTGDGAPASLETSSVNLEA